MKMWCKIQVNNNKSIIILPKEKSLSDKVWQYKNILCNTNAKVIAHLDIMVNIIVYCHQISFKVKALIKKDMEYRCKAFKIFTVANHSTFFSVK